jgi:HSP20 family protein
MKGSKELIKPESTRALSPFEELEKMERWFEDIWRRPFSLVGSPLWAGGRISQREEQVSPSVDIYDAGKELAVTVDLPGVRKEDLQVNLEGRFLTISGEKKKEEEVEKDNYYRYERSHGTFTRRFELPEGLESDKAKAHYENGVLRIEIPKSKEAVDKAKHIPIE